MSLTCIDCGIDREYYCTEENASRQNCQVSDSGYHRFHYLCCGCIWFGVKRYRRENLLKHRRSKRPATI